MMLHGIDVSNWQGNVGWNAVAASGVVFAFAKSSEAATYKDPFFSRNWESMKAVGIQRGAYHFARPTNNALEEAANFVSVIANNGGLLPGDMVCLDMEDDSTEGDLLEWTLTWLRAVEGALGVRPILYSTHGYLARRGLGNIRAVYPLPLWIADWRDPAGVPPDCAIWQYSDRGTVPGIQGGVDLNGFFGTAEELRALGKAAGPGPFKGKDDALRALDCLWGISESVGHLSPQRESEMQTWIITVKDYILK